MSDGRWQDVLASVESAERHLAEAVALFNEGGLEGRGREAYRRQMAFMHSMAAGYTSLEVALLRCLSILDEAKPSGDDWHAQLLQRVARPAPGLRPAILSADAVRLARKLKSFRHWSLHSYDDDFAPPEASIAVEATKLLLPQLRASFERFIAEIDP